MADTKEANTTPNDNSKECNCTAPLDRAWTHNNYSLYVNEERDLIGLIAYSLYKQHKIVFIQSEVERTKEASPEAVRSFCHAYAQSHQVELLRDKAELLLETMNEELLDYAINKLNKEYQDKLKKELKEGMPLGRSIFHSLMGNIATGAFIALAVWGTSTNFDQLAERVKTFLGKPDTTKVEDRMPSK